MDEQTKTLREIESVSVTIGMRARWVSEDVNRLVNLPAWETNAEDSLDKAEDMLARALSIVQQAKALLKKKRQPKAVAAT